MQIFISWSGTRSQAVALKLRTWLKDVIQTVEPWMSRHDIEAGARWSQEIAAGLENTNFGILCLTPENIHADWILFEAGALAKTLDAQTRVCPYCIGMRKSDIPSGPLTQFQAKEANEEETYDLLKTINVAMGSALSEEDLKRYFDRWWPELKEDLDNLPEAPPTSLPKRRTEDMMEEVLNLVRGISREVSGGTPDTDSSPQMLNARRAASQMSTENQTTMAEYFANSMKLKPPLAAYQMLKAAINDLNMLDEAIAFWCKQPNRKPGEVEKILEYAQSSDGFCDFYNLPRRKDRPYGENISKEQRRPS